MATSAGVSNAAEPRLTFRGFTLGDSVAAVQSRAEAEFSDVKPARGDDDATVIEASDGGLGREYCPVSAPLFKRQNCLNARFIFRQANGVHRLAIIAVSQSFSPSIPRGELTKRLRNAYGEPRRKYEGRDIALNVLGEGSDDVALVWGGVNVPVAPFRPATAILYPDYELVGGSYVTAIVYGSAREASGYALQIVDSGRIVEAGKVMMKRLEQERAAQERANVKSVKF
jgi:hypothetical protein